MHIEPHPPCAAISEPLSPVRRTSSISISEPSPDHSSPKHRLSLGTLSPQQSPTSPGGARARGHVAALLQQVRTERRAFWDGIGRTGRTKRSFTTVPDCPLRCEALAAVAAGLSYVDQFQDDDSAQVALDQATQLSVTIDRIVDTLLLPLASLRSSHTSILEVHEVVSMFLTEDSQFCRFRVDLKLLDHQLTEDVDGDTEIDSISRVPSLDPNEFRQIVQSNQHRNACMLVFFDRSYIEQDRILHADECMSPSNLSASFAAKLMTGEGSFVGTLSSSPRHIGHRVRRTQCGVVVGVGRQDGQLEIAVPRFTQNRGQMEIFSLRLNALHQAMMIRNPLTGQPNGFLTIYLSPTSPTVSPKESQTIAAPLALVPMQLPPAALEGSLDSVPAETVRILGRQSVPISTPRVSTRTAELTCSGMKMHRLAVELDSPLILFPLNVDIGVATHLLAIAHADAVFRESPGIDLNTVVRAALLPESWIAQGPLPFGQVYSYAKYFFGTRSPRFNVFANPILKLTTRAGGEATMSSSELVDVLLQLKAMNNKSLQAMILVNFNANVIHGSVIALSDPSHWAIVGDIAEDTHDVEIVESCPKSFGPAWKCGVLALHRAMLERGYIVISKEGVDVSQLLHCSNSIVQDHLRAILPYHPGVARALADHTDVEPLANVPLSLAAKALAKLVTGKSTTFSTILGSAATSLSHYFCEGLTMYDFARTVNSMGRALNLDVKARVINTVFDLLDEQANTNNVQVLVEILKRVCPATGNQPDAQVIFNYALRKVPLNSRVTTWTKNDFALFLGFADESQKTLVVQDVNPINCMRVWSIDVETMFQACSEYDELSSLPMGYIVIHQHSKENQAEEDYGFVPVINPNFWKFDTPTLTPFFPTFTPQLEAVSMGLSCLGHHVSQRGFLYSALSKAETTEKNVLCASALAGTALTLAMVSRLVELFAAARMLPMCVRKGTSDLAAEVEAILKAAPFTGITRSVIIVIHDPLETRHPNCEAGLTGGIVKAVKGNTLRILEAQTSSFEEEWETSIDKLSASFGEGTGRTGYLVLQVSEKL